MKLLCIWMRDLHFYLGLFFCPVILIFAVSTVQLNHPERLSGQGRSAPGAHR